MARDLAEAMKTNPRLKVMVNGGYYDLATPFLRCKYEDKHLPIPQPAERISSMTGTSRVTWSMCAMRV